MRKMVFALVCALFAAAGAFTGISFMRSDRTPPVISVSSVSSQMVCDPELSEEELLKGVKAKDAVDGDVSRSLVVEAFTVDPQKGTGIVVYAARDGSNNVAKYTRTLDAPAGYTEEKGFGASTADEETEAESDKDRKLDTLTVTVSDRKTEHEMDSEVKNETESETETVEVIETETETELETETETETEEIQETNPGAPKLILTQHSVRLKRGDTFNPVAYVDAIEDYDDNIYALWRDIQVTGEYDMTEKGTYTLYYYVIDSYGNMSNRERFRLIVE